MTLNTDPTTTLSNSSSPEGNCLDDADNVHETVRHYALVALTPVILITNLVVLLLLAAHRPFRRPDLLLIASLCCADLMVGAACIATIVTRAREATLSGCLLRTGLSVFAVQASIFCLLAVACDRLVAIVCALRYNHFVTYRRAMIAVLLLWGLALLFGLLPLLGWNRGEELYAGYCSFLLVFPPSFVATSFVLALLPIGAILLIHAYLYSQARVHIRRIDAMERVLGQKPCGTLGMSVRSWKCVRTVTLVAGCVLACWCPFLLTSLYALITERAACIVIEVVGTHLLVLGYVNSALNPVVYVLRNKELKAVAWATVARMCKKRDS
ncbi:sphingosine 1-phosphate receptor 5-like [Littorina saxatilis]|uniref:sphingosine 1-phosphate receptor 5-like n=1 Tax=Littorina saxatilis TaxID=31220 RepID=UPI0038B427BB